MPNQNANGGEPPLRVAFLSSCVRGGGAGWSLYYLLKYLDRDRIEPLVIVPERGVFDQRFEELGLEVLTPKRLHHRWDQQLFKWKNPFTLQLSRSLVAKDLTIFIPWLVQLIRERNIEVVYCNNMMVKPLGAIAAQVAGISCALHVRNLHEKRLRRLAYGSLAKLPAVRWVISNSRASAEPYKQHVPDKIHVVHNGVDLSEYGNVPAPPGTFRQELGIPIDATVVGYTGNIIPRKAVDILIRAMAELMPSRPDLYLVIVGRVPLNDPTDYHERCHELTNELGIREKALFPGFRADVRYAVQDFDILSLPSRQEPFGRSIVEGMALRKPIVATRVGGIPEIIDSGVHGLLVEPEDVRGLADALGRLVDDPGLAKMMGCNAAERVQAAFDARTVSKNVEEILLS